MEMQIIIIIEKQCGGILIHHLNFINLLKLLMHAEKLHNIIINNKLFFIIIIKLILIKKRSNAMLKIISMHFQEEQHLWHLQTLMMILIILLLIILIQMDKKFVIYFTLVRIV